MSIAACNHLASKPTVSWPCLWLGKMSETNVKMKYIGCWNDTLPKTVMQEGPVRWD